MPLLSVVLECEGLLAGSILEQDLGRLEVCEDGAAK